MKYKIEELKHFIPDLVRFKKFQQINRAWLSGDQVLPVPPSVKWEIVKKYAKYYQIDFLIETGTFMGDMIYANRRKFKEIHSIELSKELHYKSKKRFANQKNIFLYQGDSKDLLTSILYKLKGKKLFWLDAHYSGLGTEKSDTVSPIEHELEIILATRDDTIVLIDDARLFTVEEGYPDLQKIIEYIKLKGYRSMIRYDIIHVVPTDKDFMDEKTFFDLL